MKRVILFRHAKSDWDAGAASDHARPLNRRGTRAARTMGTVLAQAGVVPERIVTSSATRARTTVELAAEAGQWDRTIHVTDELYGASAGEVLRHHIQTQPDAVSSVMLVGHEPTWSQLASVLSGGSSIRVATATAVAIDFQVPTWALIEPGRGSIEWMLSPRLFESWDPA